jgi:hypothetical protein
MRLTDREPLSSDDLLIYNLHGTLFAVFKQSVKTIRNRNTEWTMIKKSFFIAITAIFLITVKGMASEPVVMGHLDGVELCAQFQCGVAAFVGRFNGQLNSKWSKGGFLVFINHDPLPGVGQIAKITGGEWSLRADGHLLQGNILNGTLVNNADATFTVTVLLQVNDGGNGEIIFGGGLTH